jgi:hypothetical protein
MQTNDSKNINNYFGLQVKKMLFLLSTESTALILLMAIDYMLQGLLLFELSVMDTATVLRPFAI